MPPEQFTDTRSVDQRADIYSLGCTLYRLLTDQKPYPGKTVADVFRGHTEAPIPSLRAMRPDIPEQLDAVFQKMLAKQPSNRQA
jgi:serine/threonine-protein kinase